MYRFWHSIIGPLCEAASVRTIVEIGVGEAPMTCLLVEYAKAKQGHVHAIDPVQSHEIRTLTAETGPLLTFHHCTSLEVLPTLRADAVLIDGDHNWYTVFHELQTIALWHSDPLIFLHDTQWPYGKRDLYYDTSRIPEEYRHPSAQLGMDPSSSDLLNIGGLNAHTNNACHEGGERNGVLTAVEDFLKAEGHDWHWQNIPGIHGLGMLIPKSRLERTPKLVKLLADLHLHPIMERHLEATECDRLHHLACIQSMERRMQTAAQATENTRKCIEQSPEKNEHIAKIQRQLDRIQQTRSWRWTRALRACEASLRDVMHTMRRVLRLRRRQILVIDEKPLTPDQDSASLRMTKLMETLRALGSDVTFLSSDKNVEGHLAKNGGCYDAVLLSRAPVAARYFAVVREYAPRARIIFDTVDLHGLRLSRKAALSGHSQDAQEARRCAQQELWLARHADCTVAVSDHEANVIRDSAPDAAVFTISNIHDVAPAASGFNERRDILFIGNFSHAPNADALRYFVEEIFPHVHLFLPDVYLHVIGQGSKAAQQNTDTSHIILHGHVHDLKAHINGVRLTVAPIRFGAGVKGKIHSSLACGTPIVTTSIGAEGMHLQHHRNCLIADDPISFAQEVHRLYNDRDLWEQLSVEGLRTMKIHFSAEVAKKRCEEMLRILDMRTPSLTRT